MSLQDVNTEDQNSFFVPTISHDITKALDADQIIMGPRTLSNSGEYEGGHIAVSAHQNQ